ncbi:hypothetical protein BN1708_019923, partial [Verticillium longisporum]
PPVGRHL